MKHWCVIVMVLLFLAGVVSSQQHESLYAAYHDAAAKLIGAAMVDSAGWAKLEYLCDRIGNRVSGSETLEQAVEWSAAQMKKDGLENVTIQPVDVPHWVRGQERASLVSPITRPLSALGLGGSIATPAGGITAEVIPVRSFDNLEKKGRAAINGKIVLYNEPNVGYGQTVPYRSQGASRAAKLGAVAALVRSVDTAFSLQTVHTGAMNYGADAPKIPAAALSVEDALLIQRLSDSGETVRVHLEMQAQTLPDAKSANVIGEIRGSEKPEEVVVIGGHLDSWDVGQGAHDDGTGIMAALEAARLVRELGLRPKRTLRVVFWVNEENGSAGARAYRESLGANIKQHVAAIEMDGGAERPVGFSLTAGHAETGLALMQQIGRLLQGIEASEMTMGSPEADVAPLARDGVPVLGLRTVAQHYFDWHHTTSDTLDKVDPQDFRKCIAALAITSYILADMPGRL